MYLVQRLVFPTDFNCLRTIPLAKLVNPLSHSTWNVCENVLSCLLGQQRQALGYSHLSEITAARLSIRSLPS
ncbi:hypothetical protein DAPPUDRAFT_267989 [Daphnia pulex]|uniref:Uncharacterized protein n=1 Tax=Daphnia pulex TaxID=6669 RepID=E9HX61_DAPPU|nr:hypothetical protein DAPPUDRAFT_267989 [Daphnia pulex]|eukprot:EFX63668.1 hypothetical protein DAPPUDRAFT_267989 [Daphnia pulex]